MFQVSFGGWMVGWIILGAIITRAMIPCSLVYLVPLFTVFTCFAKAQAQKIFI
jgi:hypothetical protein